MRVVPGDPDANYLIDKLEGTQACGSPMPHNTPLSPEQISLIRRWIAEGAQDN